MARNVCYAVEEIGREIIITQQKENSQVYIKMSRASAHWVAQQLWDIFNAKTMHEQLSRKVKISEISRAQKVADFLFGGKDETKH